MDVPSQDAGDTTFNSSNSTVTRGDEGRVDLDAVDVGASVGHCPRPRGARMRGGKW